MDKKRSSSLTLLSSYYPCIRMGTVRRTWNYSMWIAMVLMHQNAQWDSETVCSSALHQLPSQPCSHSNVIWQRRMLPKDDGLGRNAKERLPPGQEECQRTPVVSPCGREELQLTGSQVSGTNSCLHTLQNCLTSRSLSNSHGLKTLLFPQSYFSLSNQISQESRKHAQSQNSTFNLDQQEDMLSHSQKKHTTGRI